MNILIVDDEPLARLRLQNLLKEIDAGYLLREAANGEQALTLLQQQAIDIVLLDIQMPGMNGLSVAQVISEIETPPAIIFTTAYDQHALQAFQVNASGYLLKPVRKEELSKALANAGRHTRAHQQTHQTETTSRSHISAQVHGNIKVVPIEEIIYFRADQKYVNACHTGGELILEESLKSLEQEFAADFIRVHRNALVNRRYIRQLERHNDGTSLLWLQGVEIPLEVSRRQGSELKRLLKEK